MTAYFIVRAQVENVGVKDSFDHWYQAEHLPDALKAFNARRAWRGWSAIVPSVHFAYYEFDTMAQAQAIQGSDALKGLIAEFDRVWGDKVTRSRDFVEVIQTLGT
jgi:hypothetical protein